MGITSFKDWYKRSGEGYTKSSRFKSRIGWEKSLDEEDSYSSYFWKPRNNVELIRKSYDLAKDMIIVMNPPFKVNIQISQGDDNFTNGRKVVISSTIFDNESYSEGEKLDIFCGQTIHEGCHLLYTEFAKFETWSGIRNPVKKFIFNVLEDERIEEELGSDKPGLVRFLEKVKYYYFDTLYLKSVDADKRRDKMNEAEKLLDIFLSIVRYPKYLTEDIMEDYGDILMEIKEKIVPLPKDTKDTLKAAEEIYLILKKKYKDLMDQESEEGETKKKDSGSSTGKSRGASEFDSMLSKFLKKAEGLAKDPKYGKDKDSYSTSLDGTEISSSLKGESGKMVAQDIEGLVEKGSTRDVLFLKEKDDKYRYQEHYNNISKYITAIRKSIKGHCRNYELIHRGCRSGILDTDKLAEAYQGVPCVYLRKGEVKTSKVSVCLLIDESGSMYGDKIYKARDTAILLNEALKNLPGVELFIYGHTGDSFYSGATEIRVYREPGYTPKYSLGSVNDRRENRDGRAIEEVAFRVRKQTKEQVLYFIISDGEPSADNYRGDFAIHDTRDSVLRTEKLGFNIIQICVDKCYDPGKMFKNYLIMTDLNSLAVDLAKLIKKATIGAAKTSIY
jgi:hypothetical protein